ncbi:MAG: LamG domain-containing protein [Prevotella sp.]|nr:LamG domain-containing protein [Prevotella sp.]
MIKHLLFAALFLAAGVGGCNGNDDDNGKGNSSSVIPGGGSGGSGGSGSGSGGEVSNNYNRGLIDYFTFDDGTGNNSKNPSNNGIIIGDYSLFITDTPNGKGQALQIMDNEYFKIPKNAVEDYSTFSISMWVKDFGGGALFVSTFKGDTFRGSPRLFVDGSNYFMADGTEEIFDTSVRLGPKATSYQSNTWHMLTATFANNKINFYIDGSLAGNATHSSKTKAHGELTGVGGIANGIMSSSMKVDNIRVHGVALTDTEVQSLYNYERQ